MGGLLLSFLFSLFVLPETLESGKEPFNIKKANPLKPLKLVVTSKLTFWLSAVFFIYTLIEIGLRFP